MKMIRCKKWCGFFFKPGELYKYDPILKTVFSRYKNSTVSVDSRWSCDCNKCEYPGLEKGAIAVNKYTFAFADWNNI